MEGEGARRQQAAIDCADVRAADELDHFADRAGAADEFAPLRIDPDADPGQAEHPVGVSAPVALTSKAQPVQFCNSPKA